MKYNVAQAVSNWEILERTCNSLYNCIKYLGIPFHVVSYTVNISIEKRSRYERSKGDLSCGGVIDTPGQIIKSTNYPNDYDNGLDCRWLIEFDHACEIRLTIVDFELESGTSMPSNPCP